MFDNIFVVVEFMAPNTAFFFYSKTWGLLLDMVTGSGQDVRGQLLRWLWVDLVHVTVNLLLRSLRYFVSSNRWARIVSGHGHCEWKTKCTVFASWPGNCKWLLLSIVTASHCRWLLLTVKTRPLWVDKVSVRGHGVYEWTWCLWMDQVNCEWLPLLLTVSNICQ